MTHTPTLELLAAYRAGCLSDGQVQEVVRILWTHDELVAALQNLFTQCCNGSFERPFSKDENELLDAARSALAKAEAK